MKIIIEYEEIPTFVSEGKTIFAGNFWSCEGEQENDFNFSRDSKEDLLTMLSKDIREIVTGEASEEQKK